MSFLIICCTLFIPNALAYSFLSTHEAYLLYDSSVRCMGDCYEKDNGQFVCASEWSGKESPCKTTWKPTLRYRTDTNKECVSNCDYYGETYQWCATSQLNWGKCSRKIALEAVRTRESNDVYRTCSSECVSHRTSSPWCNVVGRGFQPCNPDAITHTFNYPTLGGSTCVTRCKLYGDEPKCYSTEGNWDRCFLNPSYIDELNSIDTNLQSHCPFGEYEQYESRGYHSEAGNKMNFTCDADVDEIAKRHRSNNPTVVLRDTDSNNTITADKNPILSYTVLPAISYFNDDSPFDLPLVITALLTNHTLAPKGTQDAFMNRVDANYDGLDRNLQHLQYNERGHILASRLGGPLETFNVFPEPWRMHRGRTSMWYGLEIHIENFLRGHANRYVLFKAVLSYASDNRHVLVRRPTAIMLRVRAFNNGVMVHLDGTPVNHTSPNTLENMYFSNDPEYSYDSDDSVTGRTM